MNLSDCSLHCPGPVGRGGKGHWVPASGGRGQNLCAAACVGPGVQVQTAPRTFTARGTARSPGKEPPRSAAQGCRLCGNPRMYQHVSHTSAFSPLRNRSFCELACLRFGPTGNEEPGWLTFPIHGSGRGCPACFPSQLPFPCAGITDRLSQGPGRGRTHRLRSRWACGQGEPQPPGKGDMTQQIPVGERQRPSVLCGCVLMREDGHLDVSLQLAGEQ